MENNSVLSNEQAAYWLKELTTFGALPNNVYEAAQIKQNAAYLQALLVQNGFTVQLWNTPSDKPYVYASLQTDAALPTLLFYSHYDGVPVEPANWSTAPFQPVIKHSDGSIAGIADALATPEVHRIYARSIADSKNAVISLLAALDAIRATGATPGINIKLLLDGEEELESPFLHTTVLAHRQELQADLVISASGETHQSGLPTIAFGVRGILLLDLTLHTASADMHSGHFGGFTPNAALEMAHLLTLLKNCQGQVLVPGFYQGINPMTEAERLAIRQVPAIEHRIRQQFAIRKTEQSNSLQELINQPTFNIRGLQAGYVGESAGNIIPATAQASIDMRLVEGMDPDKVYAAIIGHLTRNGISVSEHAPTPAELYRQGPILQVKRNGSFRAVKTPMASDLPRQVLGIVQQSTAEAWVVEPTEGGSLNFEVFRTLGIPLITLPVSNFDCNQHTRNENLRLDFFLRGIGIFKALLAFTNSPADPLKR